MRWRNRQRTHFRLRSCELVKLIGALAIVDAIKLQVGCPTAKPVIYVAGNWARDRCTVRSCGVQIPARISINRRVYERRQQKKLNRTGNLFGSISIINCAISNVRVWARIAIRRAHHSCFDLYRDPGMGSSYGVHLGRAIKQHFGDQMKSNLDVFRELMQTATTDKLIEYFGGDSCANSLCGFIHGEYIKCKSSDRVSCKECIREYLLAPAEE